MRYAFKDLGEQEAGTEVTVTLEGTAANVLLLDPHNYAQYQAAKPFRYTGGIFHRSPARLTVPRDGRWHLVVDLGGYRGRVRARIAGIAPAAGARPNTVEKEESEPLRSASTAA